MPSRVSPLYSRYAQDDSALLLTLITRKSCSTFIHPLILQFKNHTKKTTETHTYIIFPFIVEPFYFYFFPRYMCWAVSFISYKSEKRQQLGLTALIKPQHRNHAAAAVNKKKKAFFRIDEWVELDCWKDLRGFTSLWANIYISAFISYVKNCYISTESVDVFRPTVSSPPRPL